MLTHCIKVLASTAQMGARNKGQEKCEQRREMNNCLEEWRALFFLLSSKSSERDVVLEFAVIELGRYGIMEGRREKNA